MAAQKAERERRQQEEEAEAARLRAEAKAAADAIRRAEAEAAAKLEKERQARELARIGKGLNEQCPYITLEATANEGKLSTDEMNCLESSMDKAGTGVDKANVSMVLLTNARAKGDIEQWEQRMEHHLTNIEREKPCVGVPIFSTFSKRAQATVKRHSAGQESLYKAGARGQVSPIPSASMQFTN